MHPIHVGTCGWSYKGWEGAFYPSGTATGDYLAHYATRYPVVEVDTTFYRIPSRRMVEGWRDRTPASFGLSLKVPQVITHEKALRDCQDEVDAFLGVVGVLGPRLVCCLLQFGYFPRDVIPSLNHFLDRLDPFLAAWPKDVPVAVEVRNKYWTTTELTDCLRRYGAVWALADQKWMPSPLQLIRRMDVVTGPFAYVRLLGDRDEVDLRTKSFDRVVVDRSEQLRAAAEATRLLSERVPVLTFVNNHFAGHAPETIRQFRELLS